MGDFSGLILLLLPLAAATGWFVARQSHPREEQEAGGLNPDYVRGISHLVNNDTDQAIEVFIGLMDADEGTIDLHLALGNLYRRRGEVERALRIHQNLVERKSLKPLNRNQARYELARDYLAAGVLDRAEEIFLELAHQGMFLADCLTHLLRIYEREREWDRAMDTARWLGSAQGRDMGALIAQYLCEMAETAERQADAREQQRCIKKALQADRHCVRAQLIRAHQALADSQAGKALRIFQHIAHHDAAFIPEILDAWHAAFVACKGEVNWPQEMRTHCQGQPHPRLLAAMIKAAQPLSMAGAELRDELLAHLQAQPSWVGLHAVLDQPWPELDPAVAALLQSVAGALEAPLERSARYRCSRCGYSSRSLNWQCPTCHNWNSTLPLADIDHAALDREPESLSVT